jgi:hypothetical protein
LIIVDLREEKMRKNVLIAGIVLLGVGLIMFLVGNQFYQRAELNYNIWRLSEEFFGGYSGNYEFAYVFWSFFTFIGFIIFLIGIPTTITGAVIQEKSTITFPNQIIKEKISRKQKTFLCKECGAKCNENDKFCEKCGCEFIWNCEKCGKPISSDSEFCKNCGIKIEDKE